MGFGNIRVRKSPLELEEGAFTAAIGAPLNALTVENSKLSRAEILAFKTLAAITISFRKLIHLFGLNSITGTET